MQCIGASAEQKGRAAEMRNFVNRKLHEQLCGIVHSGDDPNHVNYCGKNIFRDKYNRHSVEVEAILNKAEHYIRDERERLIREKRNASSAERKAYYQQKLDVLAAFKHLDPYGTKRESEQWATLAVNRLKPLRLSIIHKSSERHRREKRVRAPTPDATKTRAVTPPRKQPYVRT